MQNFDTRENMTENKKKMVFQQHDNCVAIQQLFVQNIKKLGHKTRFERQSTVMFMVMVRTFLALERRRPLT